MKLKGRYKSNSNSTNNKTTSTRLNKKVPQMLHKVNFKGVLMLFISICENLKRNITIAQKITSSKN